MDLREYDHISKSPDAFPRSTLLIIGNILEAIDSPAKGLIEKVLREGYIEPPKEYKWHGCYRLVLSPEELQSVLNELARARHEPAAAQVVDNGDARYIGQFYEYWKRAIDEPSVPYDEAVKDQIYYDLRNATLDEFTDFIFGHEVAGESEDATPWYHDPNLWIDYHVHRHVRLYSELFAASRELLDKYSNDQLEQGAWAMMGPSFEGSVSELLWGGEITIEEKEALVTSMYQLYCNLFAVDDLDTSCNMWWDALAYDYHPMKLRSQNSSEEDRRIQNAMFDTLGKILKLDSEACRYAALHGLNHVQHPGTKKLINDHIISNPDADETYRRYAMACMRGEAM